MSDYQSLDPGAELPLFSSVNTACVVERQKPTQSEIKRQQVLEAIKSGGLSCVEVETRWHRGQAVVDTLRRMGHVIHTEDGVYRYERYVERVKGGARFLEMYLSTPHWKARALQRKQFDGFRCVRCKSEKDLETHHWRYELFNESLDDLATYCRACHQWIHERVKGSSVHFPTTLAPHVAERIERESTL